MTGKLAEPSKGNTTYTSLPSPHVLIPIVTQMDMSSQTDLSSFGAVSRQGTDGKQLVESPKSTITILKSQTCWSCLKVQT